MGAAEKQSVDVCVCSSAALLGKKVLHLDARSYYGDLWAGLNMEEFLTHIAPPHDVTDVNTESSEPPLHRFCGSPCVYEHVEVPQRNMEELGDVKDYIIELSPKVRCHSLTLQPTVARLGISVDVSIRTTLNELDQDTCASLCGLSTGGSQVSESVTVGVSRCDVVFLSYVMTEEGFVPIPASRSDIFKDRALTAMQKRKLTAFLQNAVDLLERQDHTQVSCVRRTNSI